MLDLVITTLILKTIGKICFKIGNKDLEVYVENLKGLSSML